MKKITKKIQRSLEVFGEKGFLGFRDKLRERLLNKKEAQKYQKWIENHDQITQPDRQKIQTEIDQFSHKPLISIILPVFNVEEKWLRLCLDSVLNQLYQNWGLCIADDKSSLPHIRKILDEYSRRDERIKVIYRSENGHISAASNSALDMASGEYCALLDNDDELSEKALFYVGKEINAFPDAALIYSDEDMIDEFGIRYSPNFKPDWNLQLFYSFNLINHLGVYRTDILRELEGFRIGFEGSQDYDLALRFIEKIDENQIRHIPQILYHWRAISGSLAKDSDEKLYAHGRARKALAEHFERIGEKVNISRGYAQFHRVSFEVPKNVSATVISSENITTNIENTELMRIDSVSASSFNSAVKGSKGDVLIFLDRGIKPISGDWIQEILGQIFRKNVGAVGAKILYQNGNIQQCGIIGGINKSFGFAFSNLNEETQSGLFRSQVLGSFSAVSGVLAVRRELFERLNGFDSENFNKALFDLDFCLRIGEIGLQTVFTPYARFESKVTSTIESALLKKDSDEFKLFPEKWKGFIEKDKFYNPNLSTESADFSVK